MRRLPPIIPAAIMRRQDWPHYEYLRLRSRLYESDAKYKMSGKASHEQIEAETMRWNSWPEVGMMTWPVVS